MSKPDDVHIFETRLAAQDKVIADLNRENTRLHAQLSNPEQFNGADAVAEWFLRAKLRDILNLQKHLYKRGLTLSVNGIERKSHD